MTTIAKVNAAARDAGIDAELVKGRGYLYFIGSAVAGARSTSVMVPGVSILSVAEWMKELSRIVADAGR